MNVEKCRYDKTIKTCFYDGSEKSAKFIEENFSDFSYTMWTEEKLINKKFTSVKSKQLVYFCTDGDYQNIVPPNNYIIQYKMTNTSLTITDWFTEDEFKNNFKIEK